MEASKRVILYLRVSDPSQIDNNSLETQEKVCRDFAKHKGYEVVKVFIEPGKSAGKQIEKRVALREALAFCTKKQNNISFFLVYNFKRFSRNADEGVPIISLLAKHGIEVISATEVSEMNPIGRAIRTIFIALGQLENELKGEVVKDNMQSAFKKGLWVFKCPVGYRRKYRSKEENKGIPPIIDPNLAPIITRLFENASTGIYNKSQLARMMNLEGFADHYRVEADHKIVDGILKKTFYYGLMFAKKWNIYSQGLHEPLTDETTWKKAYHHLILKKKNYQYHDENSYPLKGALKCEACGHPMTTSPSRGNGGVVTYYECRQKGCKKVRINANNAHQQFDELLSSVQPTSRVIKLFQHMVFSEWDKVIDEAKNQADNIDDRIYSFKQELKSIRKAKDEGLYNIAQAKEEADKINQEIAVLEVERSEIKFEQYNTEIVRDFTERFLKNLNLLWEKLDLPKQQALLQKVFLNTLLVSEDKKIRTSKISPSFQLIEALSTSKDENVIPRGIEPRFAG
ncbi:MAG: recombinase family protein [Patescibacteria group bacterium]|jgi:site-specific DNA recombinase